MRPAPSGPVNKVNMASRVQEVEVVAANALTEAKRAHARLDCQLPPTTVNVPVKGERGSQGNAGRDGRDGKDGVGQVGTVGPQGRPGKDCQCKTELAEQRIASVEQKLADARSDCAVLCGEVSTLRAEIQALVDMQKNAGTYLEWLRAKRLAREKKQ